MGFLFFLLSLFLIFISGFSSKADLDIVFQRGGVAVLTTIVGLIMRQLLYSYDPAESQQETFIRDLSTELRESANRYREAQGRLFNLVDEFIKTKESLYSKEENISMRYIEAMYKAMSAYSDVNEKFALNIEGDIKEVKDKIGLFKLNIGNLLTQINEDLVIYQGTFKDKISAGLSNLNKAFDLFTSDQTIAIQNNYISALKTSASNITSVHSNYSKEISFSLDVLKKNILDATQIIGLNSEEYFKKFDQLNKKIESLPLVIEEVKNTINKVNLSYGQVNDSIFMQTKKFEEGLGTRLGQFEKELDSINHIIRDFLELAKKYIKNN